MYATKLYRARVGNLSKDREKIKSWKSMKMTSEIDGGRTITSNFIEAL